MSRIFSCQIEIRFADLDAYGHVNNAIYFTYLESARTKAFASSFVDFLNAGLYFVVVQAECEYKKPIKLDDQFVHIEFTIEGLGRSSFTVNYRLLGKTGQHFANAKTVMVAIDAKSGTPTGIPEDVRQRLLGT